MSDPYQRASPSNLIHQWIGRDAESRQATPAQKAPANGPTKDKRKLLQSMAGGMSGGAILLKHSDRSMENTSMNSGEQQNTPDPGPTPTEQKESSERNEGENSGAVEEPDPLSSAYDDLFSQCPPTKRREVHDFNARMQSQQAKRPPKCPIINTETADIPEEEDEHRSLSNEDDPVAVEDQSSRPALNAFERMQGKRTPGDAARTPMPILTISAGDGTPDSKKRRIYNPKNSQTIAKFGASPLLARSLREFAAPGTQPDGYSSDEEMADPLPEGLSQESESGQSQNPSDSRFMTHTQALIGDHGEGLEPDSPHSESASQTSLPDDLLSADRPFIETNDSDDEYLDEADKKLREDAKVARMIQEAEEAAAQPTSDSLHRASQILKAGGSHKDATINLTQPIETSIGDIMRQVAAVTGKKRDRRLSEDTSAIIPDDIGTKDAESKLSLTISKSDFLSMRIVGQFNLGFILAVRPSSGTSTAPSVADQDHIFIIDQHAADEKYNFERLSQNTTLNPQRLVQPKPLQLTAVEEEIILANSTALVANGFELVIDESGNLPMGQRCSLLSLPTSKETTFTLSDLEELIHLLGENVNSGNDIPRPTKVRKMLAMRACRSSIMVGKTLQAGQMDRVVRHMGEMEKPWNCPHGRPTMRHLAGLGQWGGWTEETEYDDGEGNVIGGSTD